MDKLKSWVYISTDNASGHIDINENDIITHTPPVWDWVIGNTGNFFQNYLLKKKQLLDWQETFY